jgi:hypothetical protein
MLGQRIKLYCTKSVSASSSLDIGSENLPCNPVNTAKGTSANPLTLTFRLSITISNMLPSEDSIIGPFGSACRTIGSSGALMFIMLNILTLDFAAFMAPKAAEAIPPIPWHESVSMSFWAPFEAVPASMAMGSWVLGLS